MRVPMSTHASSYVFLHDERLLLEVS